MPIQKNLQNLHFFFSFEPKLKFFCQAHHLNLEQQGRTTATEAYIYRHSVVTRSTTTGSITVNNNDYYSTSTSFLHYYQPPPTFVNEHASSNQTENICPRQKNVHRNCQRSCHGTNQNTNCRQQKVCVCDHNCGFSCLSRSKKREFLQKKTEILNPSFQLF